MQIRRVHVEVRGRVQGVAYRASTQERARELGLTGWVRNEACGAGSFEAATQVTLEAQGAAEAVDRLVTWCRTGPPAARVDELTLAEMDPVDGEVDFRIAATPRAGARP